MHVSIKVSSAEVPLADPKLSEMGTKGCYK